MKLTITLDILPSEVMALLNSLRQTNTPETPKAPPAKFVRVIDNASNRDNGFWQARIGLIGKVAAERPDGLWDVQFDLDPFPVEGVDPSRFA
jgi:hypothetical protein